MEVPRSTFQRTVTTVGPYTRAELEVDVPVKVPKELPLQVCHDQRLVEVRRLACGDALRLEDIQLVGIITTRVHA